jgi:SAM-dependent methyltransferase
MVSLGMKVESAGAGERGAESAYEAIAPVYDDFTSHHKYDFWIGHLLSKLEKNGLQGDRLLDVACGTGKSFLPMLKRGWKVTGCDISAAMVEIARTKVGPETELFVADMRELPKVGEFDLVMCLDDAVNYLLDEDELVAALSAMRANLAPTGLLIFDVNTIITHRTFFAEEVVMEKDGRRLIWRGHASRDTPPEGLVEASFEVESLDPSAGPSIPPELHRQRHYPEPVMRAALARAGLEVRDLYGHGEDGVPVQPLLENEHTKAVYIAGPAA